MALTKENNPAKYQITGYDEKQITINGEAYSSSLIVTPDTLITNWPLQTMDELSQAHIDTIIALKPELILIGTGKAQHIIDSALLARCYEQRIGVEVMITSSACKTYNVLTADGRRVAAALMV